MHQHESEIGKGYGDTSLKSELASMKARLVVESGDWAPMKGQGSFDNIDELFALGMASIPLRDPGRADAAFEQLTNAAKTIPDRDAREVAQIMAVEIEGLIKLGRGDRGGALASLARAAQLEAERPRPIARPYHQAGGELYARDSARHWRRSGGGAAVQGGAGANTRASGVPARPGPRRQRRRPARRGDQGGQGLPRRVAPGGQGPPGARRNARLGRKLDEGS